MIGEAIGQFLPFAVAISLSPIPIIGVVLMLGTPRARVNGPAFLLGWVIGLSLVGGIILAISSGAGASEGGAAADWVSWLKVVLGLLLLVVAARQWRSRPASGEQGELPSWMRSVDHFTPGRATAMGVALSAINPKNLILIVGGAAAIAQTGMSTSNQVAALAVFVVIATIGPAIPVAIYFTMRSRATELLGDIKDWMATNNGAIMAVLCLLIGAKLIGDGITGLS